MIFVIEAIVLCLLFTAIVVPSVIKNPLAWISDYPPEIQKCVQEMGMIPIKQKPISIAVVVRKAVAGLLMVIVLTAALIYINEAKTFAEGFRLSYGLCAVIVWYDALVLDCLWFCHSKKVVIPGTESLEKSYHDYWFHIKMSMIGMLLIVPIGLLTGLAVMVFA